MSPPLWGELFPNKSDKNNRKRARIVQTSFSNSFKIFGILLIAVSLIKSIIAIRSFDSPYNEIPLFIIGVTAIIVSEYLNNSSYIEYLLTTSGKHARDRRSLLFIYVSICLSVIIILLKVSVEDIYQYKRILSEGGILEYMQSISLFYSSWLAYIISRDFWKRFRINKYSILFGLISILLLFVGLEEIAWGQILFGWETPTKIALLNEQNQTTFHNLKFFQDYLDLNLFLVSTLVFILVVWRPSFKKSKEIGTNHIDIGMFMIPKYLWPMLMISVILSFFIATEYAPSYFHIIDQEWAEFILYTSTTISLIRTYILVDFL